MQLKTATLSITMLLAACAGKTSAVETTAKTDAVEAPAKVEAVEAPAKAEAVEAPAKVAGNGYTEFSNITWKAAGPKGDHGPMMSPIHGSPKTGPVSFIFKLPAGYSSGLHTHPADYAGVVVSGTIVHGKSAEVNESLSAGAAWTQIANQAHYTACTKEAECIVVGHFDGPVATTPAEGIFEGDLMSVMTQPDKAVFKLLNPKKPKGPQILVLSGDYAKGDFRALIKAPVGFKTPPHMHAAHYAGASVSGTMQKNGGAGLPPGSVWTQAGNEAHTNACVSDSPCIFFVAMDGAFSMTPAKKAQ